MELKSTGTIIHEGCTIRSTPNGWNVSCGDTHVGDRSTLVECETLIDEHKQRVRKVLADVQRQREARKASEASEAQAIADATKPPTP